MSKVTSEGREEAAARSSRTVWVVGVVSALLLCALVLIWIGRARSPPVTPPSVLNKGIAYLESYRTRRAVEMFESLAAEHPAWEAPHVNLGIALVSLEEPSHRKRAEEVLRGTLDGREGPTHAWFWLGVLYRLEGRNSVEAFSRVVGADGQDAHARYFLALALLDEGEEDAALEALEEATRLQPALAPAWRRLADLHGRRNEPEKRRRALGEYERLEVENFRLGVPAKLRYGEGGKYSLAMTEPPGNGNHRETSGPRVRGIFSRRDRLPGPAVVLTRPDGQTMTPALAAFGFDGIGGAWPAVVLCGVRVGETSRMAVASAGKVVLPFDAVVCAVGDVDGDMDTDGPKGPDIVAAAPGWIRILANPPKHQPLDAWASDPSVKEIPSGPGFPLRLYLVDIDRDWDLDIACLRQERTGDGRIRSRMELLENRDTGAFADRAQDSELSLLDFPAAEMALADWDEDHDMDLLVIDGESGRAQVYANDRGWRWRGVEQGNEAPSAPGVVSMAGGDLDGDGDQDLVLFCGERLHVWRNSGGLRFRDDDGFARRHGKLGGTAGAVFDFQDAMKQSVLVLDPVAREEDSRAVLIPSPSAAEVIWLDLGKESRPPKSSRRNLAAAIAPPDLVVYDAASGVSFHSIRGASAILVDLEGASRDAAQAGFERSNLAGIGAAVEVRVGPHSLVQHVTTGTGGTARSAPVVACGLAGRPVGADCVRILWPDGVRDTHNGGEFGLTGMDWEIGNGLLCTERQRRPIAVAEASDWMNHGVQLLEKYSYGPAYLVFERLAAAFPDWQAAHVNHGMAALNLLGDKLVVAERAFGRARGIDDDLPHAWHSLGILFAHDGRIDAALEAFSKVIELDPEDPHALYFLAKLLQQKGDDEQALRFYERALRLQPSFASAWYSLAQLYALRKDRDKQRSMLEEFQRLQSRKAGLIFGNKYGEGGKYNLALRGTAPPGAEVTPWTALPRPLLGEARVFAGPSPETRRPDGHLVAPALALGDLNGDGTLEVVLCGTRASPPAAESANSDGTQGLAICTIAEGGGLAVVRRLALDALVCALGDLDGDGDIDVAAAGPDWLRAFSNDGSGGLDEMALPAATGSEGFPVRLYVLDADSDWDLDVICLRQLQDAEGKIRSRVQLLSQNGDGSYRDIGPRCGVANFPFPAVEMALADWDGDIDLDLVVIDGESGVPHFFANDRVWRFRALPPGDFPRAPGVVSAAGGDLDADGDEDLVLFCNSKLELWRNDGGLRFTRDAEFSRRHGTLGGTAGVTFDFQNALRCGLLVLDPAGAPGAVFLASADEAQLERVALSVPRGRVSGLAAPLGASGEPTLVLYDLEVGAREVPIRTPGTWIAFDLNGPGRDERNLDKEHANLFGVGATVEVGRGARSSVQQLTTGTGGVARQAPRAYFGLADLEYVDYARILWPDGVLQSEAGLVSGRLHRIREVERKPTSCPVLFAWDGEEFRFVADFLGVGGLGYFQRPGLYGKPDPTEILHVPHLTRRATANGPRYEFRVLEPLEECAYLDRLGLVAVAHPADVTVLPLERFAVRGPQPGYELVQFRERLFPAEARDGKGRDVTPLLLHLDGSYAPELRKARRKGYLAETHAVELDFGDALDPLVSPSRRPVLFLHGYIEYGYSTTNFSAWQAGVVPQAPTFSVERDATWVPIREEWGFPAGYPRWMAVDLAGLLRPGDRRLRIETNLEIAWDQVFVARAYPVDTSRIVELVMERAELRFRGFPAPAAPGDEGYRYGGFHGRDHFKVMPGHYTRYGDVRELLREADDRFVVMGPGDEVSLSFDAESLAPLEGAGGRRSFFWKSAGYCKDMDLYTAHSAGVEPLPFRGMISYPYARGETYPGHLQLERYRAEWNTRVVEGGPRTPVSELTAASRHASRR